jgi:hypothetical protein
MQLFKTNRLVFLTLNQKIPVTYILFSYQLLRIKFTKVKINYGTRYPTTHKLYSINRSFLKHRPAYSGNLS